LFKGAQRSLRIFRISLFFLKAAVLTIWLKHSRSKANRTESVSAYIEAALGAL